MRRHFIKAKAEGQIRKGQGRSKVEAYPKNLPRADCEVATWVAYCYPLEFTLTYI